MKVKLDNQNEKIGQNAWIEKFWNLKESIEQKKS